MIAHLVKGLRILGERWTAGPRKWVAAGENLLDTVLRWAMLVGGGWALWLLVTGSWKILGVVVLVVIVKALRAATKAANGQHERPKVSPKPPEDRPVDVPAETFLACIWDVLDGTPAVHLATLARHLTATTGRPWTGDDVRAACRASQIPIRPKVRDLGGDRVSSGVHRDDLDPLPQPLSEGAPEGVAGGYVAGHGGNATPLPDGNATAPTPTVRRVGDLRITSTPDAHNPHRTHVAVVDPTRKKASR
ncbi:hypothetical protein V2S66_31340 [Streptomyces sp. V4-01]|uniref:Uncharacterized protein n=1 Tax=Actinacidiphila polyblastidii TaxID=3110430 RepID=A0ABU7PL45_9ACTN|nr:hypothetical protein [Streptomyces sp. V4-01]